MIDNTITKKNQFDSNASVFVCIPFHKRRRMMEFNLAYMLRTYPKKTQFCAAGSGTYDAETIAGIEGAGRLHFLDTPNKPLGTKCQMMVDFARDFNTDYIALTGSDDIMSAVYIARALGILGHLANTHFEMLAPRSWHIYNANLSTAEQFITSLLDVHYRRTIRYSTLGAGRIYRKQFLNSVDWQIFERTFQKHLDNKAEKILDPNQVFYATNTLGSVMSVKGDWNVMNSMKDIVTTPTVSVHALDLKQKAAIWQDNFDFSELDLLKHLYAPKP